MRFAALVALIAACGGNHPDAPGTCLSLPAAERNGLVADPSGHGLYWFEQVRTYAYDASLRGYLQLVHFDLATRERKVLVDHALGPLVFLHGRPVVRRNLTSSQGSILVTVADDGAIVSLSPDMMDVLDVEPLDDHTLAIVAEGDGPRAIYTVSAEAPHPVRVIDAYSVLSTDVGHVYAGVASDVVMIDVATHTRSTSPLGRHVTPQGRWALTVKDGTVRAQGLLGGQEQRVVVERDAWKLVHQLDTALARTSPNKNDVSRAYLIKDGIATKLPTIAGGATITYAARTDDALWALIGHNAANFAGDFGELSTEADVCMLPDRGEVHFDTRNVPARYALVQHALFDAAAKWDAGAIPQVLDDINEPVTVHLELKDATLDLDKLRARARDAHARVTSILGDKEIQTELEISDHRVALVRWRREYNRALVVAGMGDALLADPDEVDADVKDLDTTIADGLAHCRGTLVNRRAKDLTDVEIHCMYANDALRVVRIATVPANGSASFEETFDADGSEAQGFSATAAGVPLVVRDAAIAATTQADLDVALAAFHDTSLALVDRKPAQDALTIDLLAPPDWDDLAADARTKAAADAFERYKEMAHGKTLTLSIMTRVTNTTYTFDGVSLDAD